MIYIRAPGQKKYTMFGVYIWFTTVSAPISQIDHQREPQLALVELRRGGLVETVLKEA